MGGLAESLLFHLGHKKVLNKEFLSENYLLFYKSQNRIHGNGGSFNMGKSHGFYKGESAFLLQLQT